MTSIEEHKKTLNELEEDILEKMRLKIVPRRQRIIGFTASEAATNCFAILLHKKGLITAGFNINHKWFASVERAKSTFSFDFPHKNELIELLVKEENLRDRLCYGRSKSRSEAEEAIRIFFEVKRIIKQETCEDI